MVFLKNLSLCDYRVCSDKFVSASASTFPGYASRTRLWPLWPSDDDRRRSKQVSRNQKGQLPPPWQKTAFSTHVSDLEIYFRNYTFFFVYCGFDFSFRFLACEIWNKLSRRQLLRRQSSWTSSLRRAEWSDALRWTFMEGTHGSSEAEAQFCWEDWQFWTKGADSS